jgi:hypothetical protein
VPVRVTLAAMSQLKPPRRPSGSAGSTPKMTSPDSAIEKTASLPPTRSITARGADTPRLRVGGRRSQSRSLAAAPRRSMMNPLLLIGTVHWITEHIAALALASLTPEWSGGLVQLLMNE